MAILLTLHQHLFRLRGITLADLPDNTLLFAREEEGETSPNPSCRRGEPSVSSEGGVETSPGNPGNPGIPGNTGNTGHFTYDYHFVSELPTLPEADAGWQPTYQRYNIRVWRRGTLERRTLSVGSLDDAYAVYEETSATHAHIWVHEGIRADLRVDTIFVSMLSLERHLAPHGAYIFHCANMLYRGRSILLSGPSGAGKSTHAELWCRHVEGTRVVNGDRSLICLEPDGTYVTDGWPVCGSSGICHNERHPLGAIVFIEQTPDNQVLPEGLAPHFRRLYAQLTANHWDSAATAAAADWAMALCAQVPIITYGCNMAPDAPLPLQQALSTLI